MNLNRRLGAIVLAATTLACAKGVGPARSPREQAQAYLAQNQPEKAISLLEALHAESPRDLSIARALVEAHVKAGRTRALLERLTGPDGNALRDDAVTHYMRGLALFARAADAGEPAIAELARAVELEPQEAELHYRLGVALLESERYERALASLERAAQLAPERSGYALPLAKAYHRNGKPKPAVDALRAMVNGSPSPHEVATGRALMSELSDPFASTPKQARGKLEEGITWLQERDLPQEAIISFEEALRDFPDLSVAHTLLGLAYQRIDDPGRAVDEFRRAIELKPDDGKNYLYLGELYLGRQRPQQAEEHFLRALERDPFLDSAYLRLGDFAFERRDYAAATGRYRTLVTLAPDLMAARLKLAQSLELQGDFAAAERELKVVLEREPENLECLLRLGLLYAARSAQAPSPAERRAAADQATGYLQRVLKLQPENALASRALEQVRTQSTP